MRRRFVLIAALLACSTPVAAETTVHVGIGTPSLQFDFLYSDFGIDPDAAQRDAVVVGEPDLLVALDLCRVAGVDLEVVLGWRRSGLSWDTITRRCHRDGRIYYVELPPDVSGPPYGRACGYWRKHPKGDLVLSDDEIRELVLVRSLSRHCGAPAADVVRMRARGENAHTIAAKRGREAKGSDGRHSTADAPRRPVEDGAPPAPARGHQAQHGGGAKKHR